MKLKFSILSLLLTTLLVAIGGHFRYLVIGYPTPEVRQFTPELLRDFESEANVLVVVLQPFFAGIDDFLLNNENIRRFCFKGNLVLLREVYFREPDYHDYFSKQFGYHKEPIFLLYRNGKPTLCLEWPTSNKEAILREINSSLNS
jgi:hypothetical protein